MLTVSIKKIIHSGTWFRCCVNRNLSGFCRDMKINCHDDFIKWKQFPRYPLCEGNPSVISGFPSQRPVMRSFDVSLICTWTNGKANDRNAGDLRRHHPHYVMWPGFAVVWTKIIFAFSCSSNYCSLLTQYGILVTIGDGLSPFRCQAITWTKSDWLLSRSNRTELNDILFEILKLSFKKMHFKMSSAKFRNFGHFAQASKC